MSRTPETQPGNPIARAFSRLFHRDTPTVSTTTREITPRVVPAPGEVTSASPSNAAAERATPPTTPSSSVSPTPSAQRRTYTVQPGDSLSKIALHLYGDVTRWELLYEANRDRVGDPDRIFPGQVLTVPDAPLH